MEITQLKYFKAVAETGKIVTAAERMFVTPPAISTSISQLEKELGIPLFIRHAGRLQLNRQGELLLSYVNSILGSISEAQIDLLESLSEGGHAVGLAMTASNLWIDLVSDFSESHPGISLSTATVNVKELKASTLSGRYSFLLAAEEDLPEHFSEGNHKLYLFDAYPVVMVSPEHPFAKKDRIDPKDLISQRLFWVRTNHNFYSRLLRIFEDQPFPVPEFSTHIQHVCHALVARNVGIAITTAYCLNSGFTDMRYIPLNAPGCTWPMHMYWSKDRILTKEDLLFLDYVNNYYSAGGMPREYRTLL